MAVLQNEFRFEVRGCVSEPAPDKVSDGGSVGRLVGLPIAWMLDAGWRGFLLWHFGICILEFAVKGVSGVEKGEGEGRSRDLALGGLE